MKKFYQSESYPYGDCFRTCIASILEVDKLEDVPNFMRDGEELFEEHLKKWLNDNDYMIIEYKIHGASVLDRVNFDGALCILGCSHKDSGIGHSCVGRIRFEDDSKVFYDGIHNPIKNNYFSNLTITSASFLVKRLDGLKL